MTAVICEAKSIFQKASWVEKTPPLHETGLLGVYYAPYKNDCFDLLFDPTFQDWEGLVRSLKANPVEFWEMTNAVLPDEWLGEHAKRREQADVNVLSFKGGREGHLLKDPLLAYWIVVDLLCGSQEKIEDVI
jgi:hypothetical protein